MSAEEDERASLVRAAQVVLERAGWEDFKVQLLLRETGLSARTFYRHFAGKEELFLVLMQGEYARSAARIRTAMAREDGPARKIAAWIDELVQAAGDPRRAARARLFTSQPAVLRHYPDKVAEAARLVLEPLADAIREGRSTGELPDGDPDRDPELIHQLAGTAMARALAHSREESVDEVTADVTGFVLRALGFRPCGRSRRRP
ncbi:MAG TPA: TetR/AcrR family transcriptional regulator [Acidimicrobiales bacterium]|nr:TetR/AcrR family transcriptional regulator [Acidimicrobiales bacterium]